MPQSKALNSVFRIGDLCNVKEPRFGAKGDNATDDSAAFIAAINNGQPIYVPPGTYRLASNVPIAANTKLIGDYSFAGTQTPTIALDAGITGFSMPEGSPVTQTAGVHLAGMNISGGAIGIQARNGAVGWNMEDVKFYAQTDKGIAAQGFNQEWRWRTVEFYGAGNYGMYVTNTAGVDGTASLFDKNTFDNIYTNGQTINGVRVLATTGMSVLWNRPSFIYAMQDGAYFDGGFADWTFIGLNTESNGYTGAAPVAATTGTGTAGVAAITLASTAGLNPGDQLTIAGSGTNGVDQYVGISSIPGATINLNDTLKTSVTNAEVVNYRYSDIKFAFAVGYSNGITFVGGKTGIASSVGATRYSVDMGGCEAAAFIGTVNGRPVYDPGLGAGVYGSPRAAFNLRQPNRNPHGIYIGGILHVAATAVPTVGNWVAGNRVINSAPAVGQPKSWVCTVSGAPGTWVSEGNL